MDTELNNNIPLSQPFNQPPWNYNGNESVTSLPNPDIVDWVLVELRETLGSAFYATSSNIIKRIAGFLLKIGIIVDSSGINLLTEIDGIGYTNTQKLLWKFKSVKNIQKAKLKELQETIGNVKGEIVFQYFLDNKS